MRVRKLSLPFSSEIISSLIQGDKILLDGTLYTARDLAHSRLVELMRAGQTSPIPLDEGALFYCGPSPVPPGKVCGAIGPTTSARMDRFTSFLLENGLKVIIGKGDRSPEVCHVIRKHGAVYLVATGGISALLSRRVVSRETFLWPELGAEAVYRYVVQDFPCYVAIV